MRGKLTALALTCAATAALVLSPLAPAAHADTGCGGDNGKIYLFSAHRGAVVLADASAVCTAWDTAIGSDPAIPVDPRYLEPASDGFSIRVIVGQTGIPDPGENVLKITAHVQGLYTGDVKLVRNSSGVAGSTLVVYDGPVVRIDPTASGSLTIAVPYKDLDDNGNPVTATATVIYRTVV